MDVRPATHDDSEAIRRVASESLRASYADVLSEEAVEEAIGVWYDDDRIADRIDEETVRYLVGVDDGSIVGVAEVDLADEATAGVIDWLHVDPEEREQGYGTALLERTEEFLLEEGVNRIEGRVLAENEAGNAFYQDHGYTRTGERTSTVGDREYTEHIYVKQADSDGPLQLTRAHETPEGTLYVAHDERERGSKAPLYAVYRSEDRENRYGYYCANCGSFDVVMDTMERIRCNECGNTRKPARWDDTYL